MYYLKLRTDSEMQNYIYFNRGFYPYCSLLNGTSFVVLIVLKKFHFEISALVYPSRHIVHVTLDNPHTKL